MMTADYKYPPPKKKDRIHLLDPFPSSFLPETKKYLHHEREAQLYLTYSCKRQTYFSNREEYYINTNLLLLSASNAANTKRSS